MPDRKEPPPPGTTPDATYRRALRAELDRRLTELDATSDDAFGRLGSAEGVLVALIFVLLPAVLVWLCK